MSCDLNSQLDGSVADPEASDLTSPSLSFHIYKISFVLLCFVLLVAPAAHESSRTRNQTRAMVLAQAAAGTTLGAQPTVSQGNP